jgi:hypothetical protein
MTIVKNQKVVAKVSQIVLYNFAVEYDENEIEIGLILSIFAIAQHYFLA